MQDLGALGLMGTVAVHSGRRHAAMPAGSVGVGCCGMLVVRQSRLRVQGSHRAARQPCRGRLWHFVTYPGYPRHLPTRSKCIPFEMLTIDTKFGNTQLPYVIRYDACVHISPEYPSAHWSQSS
eukprot:SAG25_NODE_942_length_4661_cov_85.334064_1_plen_122_part_10